MVNTRPVAVLYGGTFDPPHRGHQMIVDRLVSLPYVDKVIVTPAWLNPFKSHSVASPAQRLRWCRMVFDHPKVYVDPGEIDAGETVYTAQTVQRLERTYDLRYIAIGSDNLTAIETWYNFDRLNREKTWLVFERAGYETGYEKLREYRRFALDAPVSSRAIRAGEHADALDPKIAPSVHTLLTKGTP